MSTPQPRVALYLRLSVSTDDSTSIAVQEKTLRARAASEGWQVMEPPIRDNGVSGAKNRVTTDAALQLLREGKVDILAVYKLDRWTRAGLPAIGRLMETLKETPGARFIAHEDRLDSNQPTWGLIAGVLASVAEMERDNIRVRVRGSLNERRTTGRFAGGRIPYGYVSTPAPTGKGRILVPNPEAVPVVHEAADRVLAGETTYAVAHDLNGRSIPAPRGGRWSPSVLREVLTGDAIVGRVTHRGDVVRDDEGAPAVFWEPILDLQRWHQLRALLAPKAPRAQRRRAARLLSGIALCHGCGGRLYVQSSGQGYTAYSCKTRGQGGECVGVSVSAERLEEHVVDRFLSAVGEVEVVARVEELSTVDVDLAEVERSIAETLVSMGAAPSSEMPTLTTRLDDLKASREAIKATSTAPTYRLVPTGETFAQAWERLGDDVPGKRALLAPNIAVLRVGKGRSGVRGPLDSRVILVSQPAYVGDAEGMTPGAVVA